MQPQVFNSVSNVQAPLILESRSQYRSCHIQIPDGNERLAAIVVDHSYYSFFRTEKDQKRALEISAKLHQRGEVVVLTKTPKGYALWVLELDAKPVVPTSHTPVPHLPVDTPYKMLASRTQYKTCHIRVPDLNKPLAAIFFENHYYSLFKMVEDVQQAVQMIRRLSYRGEETVITKTEKGYALWILEAEASLA